MANRSPTVESDGAIIGKEPLNGIWTAKDSVSMMREKGEKVGRDGGLWLVEG